MQPAQADEFESDLGVVKKCAMQLLLPTPHERLLIGWSGVTSTLVTKLTPSSKISQIPSHTCKSLQPDTEMVEFPKW